jgi:hypothetical protein
VASNLENAKLMQIIAQQAGLTPILTIMQALPLEDQRLLGAIEHLFQNEKKINLLISMSIHVRTALLKTALIMIRAIVKCCIEIIPVYCAKFFLLSLKNTPLKYHFVIIFIPKMQCIRNFTVKDNCKSNQATCFLIYTHSA